MVCVEVVMKTRKNNDALYNWKWQYKGVAPFDIILDWCKINMKNYSVIQETIWFGREQDYAWFLLRWS